MGQNAINFATKPLAACIELTKAMDKWCFPEAMWLRTEDLTLLSQYQAEATVLSRNGVAIGQAITLPEAAAASILEGVDTEFAVHPQGLYSYSEAILPAYQNQGYGALLLHEIAVRMRCRGYTSISAHVRTRHGWNIKRTKTLRIAATRFVSEFWEDPREVVEYQQARI